MNRILNALRTPSAMLAALVLALIAQLEHTAQVFMQVVSATGDGAQVHAYAFAIAVETAVLLFVLHGHKRISYGFAIATFATNLSYYAMHGVDLTSIVGAPAWLMAGLLPAAIVGYSHTIADAPAAATPAKAQTEPGRDWWRFWRKPLETSVESPVPIDTTIAPIVQPVASGGHSEGGSVTPRQTKAGKSVVSPETKIIILNAIENGATVPDVASEFEVNPNTVRSWIARAPKHTNGVAK
jgi:hypothetical protein